ncbi:MAG: succinate dehydrogenase cytochrome b subunit [Chlorobi bacterium]|nr:succinate dehydrogenase cytochrome b subunit [Chlorobiota bacterium]
MNAKPYLLRKIISALTGLFLIMFLIVHLYDNFFLLLGEQAFNIKAKELLNNPFIRVVEVLLFISLLLHVIYGIYITAKNKQARNTSYKKINWQTPFYKRMMWLSGTVILLFLVVHLQSFLVPYRITGEANNLYQLVVLSFKNPFYTGFYVLAFIFLGFHLLHAWESAFQTLGFNHPVFTPIIKIIGWILALGITIGYSAIAIAAYIQL